MNIKSNNGKVIYTLQTGSVGYRERESRDSMYICIYKYVHKKATNT